MPQDTDNHGYKRPDKGAEDWDTPINNNFAELDTDIEIRDTGGPTEGNNDYTPNTGAKYLDTDSGVVYEGDGNSWTRTLALARLTTFAGGPFGLALGPPSNSIGGAAAVVGGGRDNFANGTNATVGGGQNNLADGEYATIAGGGPSDLANADSTRNAVYDNYGVIGGGGGNQAGTDDGTDNAIYATVAGGKNNTADGEETAIGGGRGNSASGEYATVPGGANNTASGLGATVGGGGGASGPSGNEANADYSTVAGGRRNTTSGQSATVSGGTNNTASGGGATVGGGGENGANSATATVGGGFANIVTASEATIGGGENNGATGERATVGGGGFNAASAADATVGGGNNNVVNASFGTIAGGGPSDPQNNPATTNNTVYDNYGTIGGGGNNQAGSDDSGNISSSDATNAQYATVGGGRANVAQAAYATIGGGGPSDTDNPDSTNNVVYGKYGTVAGGGDNRAGVDDDTATAAFQTVGGGRENAASGQQSTIGGGGNNTASGGWATVGGGASNTASNTSATVPGGQDNTAANPFSFAAGRNATADNDGAFVVGDSTSNSVSSDAADQAVFQQNLVSRSRVETGSRFSFSDTGLYTSTFNNGDGNDQWDLRATAQYSDITMLSVEDTGDTTVQRNLIVQNRGGVNVDPADVSGNSRFTVEGNSSDDDQLFRVRDDGTTRFLVADNGGATIGTFDSNPPAAGLLVDGDIESNGNKNFVQAVDTDDGEKEVVYTATEAGEARTETSGVAELSDGQAEIDLPEHFAWVTSDDQPLVVQVTPHAGERVQPQVTEQSPDRLVVEDFDGVDAYRISYTVKGTRDGHEDKEIVREPASAGGQPAPADD